MCGFNDVNKNSIYIRFHCSTDAPQHVNSFTGKANYYVTHVVQKIKCCVLQENVVSKQLTLDMTRKQVINMLLSAKC